MTKLTVSNSLIHKTPVRLGNSKDPNQLKLLLLPVVSFVICRLPLQTVCMQKKPDKMSGIFQILTVCLTL